MDWLVSWLIILDWLVSELVVSKLVSGLVNLKTGQVSC